MFVDELTIHEYREVFEILEYKDGMVYRTRSTGQFVHRAEVSLLPENYRHSTISTSLMIRAKNEGFVYLSLFIDNSPELSDE